MTAQTSDVLMLSSNLVSFLPGISTEDRADILNVLLLAELSASRRYDQHNRWEDWIFAYRRVLIDSGLATKPVAPTLPVTVSDEKSFRRETAKLLQAIRLPQLAAVAQSALDHMFNSAHAQSFFRQWFRVSKGRSASFQIVPCQMAASGVTNLAVCGMEMVTSTRINPLPSGLFPNPFSYRMTLTYRGWGFVYDSKVYAQHRARVLEELRAISNEIIKPIVL